MITMFDFGAVVYFIEDARNFELCPTCKGKTRNLVPPKFTILSGRIVKIVIREEASYILKDITTCHNKRLPDKVAHRGENGLYASLEAAKAVKDRLEARKE